MKPCNELLSPEDLESSEKEITKLDFQLEFLERSIIVQEHVVRARPCDRFFLEILKKFYLVKKYCKIVLYNIYIIF